MVSSLFLDSTPVRWIRHGLTQHASADHPASTMTIGPTQVLVKVPGRPQASPIPIPKEFPKPHARLRWCKLLSRLVFKVLLISMCLASQRHHGAAI